MASEYISLADLGTSMSEKCTFNARKMVYRALPLFEDTTTLNYASAIDLRGLIDLDLAQSSHALASFKQALEIRKARLEPTDPFIAYSLNNTALAHTETAELSLAHTAHQQAQQRQNRQPVQQHGESPPPTRPAR